MITAEQARELVNYDPETGIFTWKKAVNRRIRVGDIAGRLNNLGYIRLQLNGSDYQAHRLAWLMQTGEFPKQEIDHINGVRNDNRFLNLRDASRIENGRNQKMRSTNTSGFMGVSWHKKANKWCAYIKVNKIRIYLGLFANLEAAIAARKSAEVKYEFHKNHGRTMP